MHVAGLPGEELEGALLRLLVERPHVGQLGLPGGRRQRQAMLLGTWRRCRGATRAGQLHGAAWPRPGARHASSGGQQVARLTTGEAAPGGGARPGWHSAGTPPRAPPPPAAAPTTADEWESQALSEGRRRLRVQGTQAAHEQAAAAGGRRPRRGPSRWMRPLLLQSRRDRGLPASAPRESRPLRREWCPARACGSPDGRAAASWCRCRSLVHVQIEGAVRGAPFRRETTARAPRRRLCRFCRSQNDVIAARYRSGRLAAAHLRCCAASATTTTSPPPHATVRRGALQLAALHGPSLLFGIEAEQALLASTAVRRVTRRRGRRRQFVKES